MADRGLIQFVRNNKWIYKSFAKGGFHALHALKLFVRPDDHLILDVQRIVEQFFSEYLIDSSVLGGKYFRAVVLGITSSIFGIAERDVLHLRKAVAHLDSSGNVVCKEKESVRGGFKADQLVRIVRKDHGRIENSALFILQDQSILGFCPMKAGEIFGLQEKVQLAELIDDGIGADSVEHLDIGLGHGRISEERGNNH